MRLCSWKKKQSEKYVDVSWIRHTACVGTSASLMHHCTIKVGNESADAWTSTNMVNYHHSIVGGNHELPTDIIRNTHAPSSRLFKSLSNKIKCSPYPSPIRWILLLYRSLYLAVTRKHRDWGNMDEHRNCDNLKATRTRSSCRHPLVRTWELQGSVGGVEVLIITNWVRCSELWMGL